MNRIDAGVVEQSLVSRLKSNINLLAARRRSICYDPTKADEYQKLYNKAIELSDEIQAISGEDYWV